MSQRIEPFGDSWSSKCWMTLYDDSLTQSHQYHEVYETENMIECVFNFVDHFMTIFYGQHQVEVIPQKIEKMNHFLPITMINPTVIVKTTMPSTDPCYVVAFQDVSNCEPEMDNLRKSKASFLTIEYRHPEMENPIDFSLDKQWMISGNVLFSPVFVLRMLEYQSRMYYYDDRYTIRIIDKDINIYDFGMDKYIELTDTGYLLQDLELPEYNKCMAGNDENDSESDNANDADIDTELDADGDSEDYLVGQQ